MTKLKGSLLYNLPLGEAMNKLTVSEGGTYDEKIAVATFLEEQTKLLKPLHEKYSKIVDEYNKELSNRPEGDDDSEEVKAWAKEQEELKKKFEDEVNEKIGKVDLEFKSLPIKVKKDSELIAKLTARELLLLKDEKTPILLID